MQAVAVTVWDDSGGTGPPVVFTHGIFTWATDDDYGFAAQRPLARRYRLLLMDRRGYGRSPDIDRSDYAVDAADLVEVLGTEGAHLVGHANGGLAALLAAAQRPDLVRSLALIQPSAFQAATEYPAVRQLLRRVEEQTEVPHELSAEDYLRASTEGLGMPMPEPTPERLRAVRTSMRELPVWQAEIPTAALRAAEWPKLIISGTWHDAPELYRKYAGEALMACADGLAHAIGAEQLRVPGYYPHTQHPDRVNAALTELWSTGRSSPHQE